MSVVKGMYKNGLINDADYEEIEMAFAKKYGLSSFTIFR